MIHPQGFSYGPISIGGSFGGWPIKIFGSIFAFSGLGSIWVYFNRHNLDITGDPEVALILGIVFFIVGMAIVGGFKRQQLDRIRGEIQTSWGILVPFSRKRYPLSGYNKVTLGKETRTTHTKNGTHTYTVYPLRLEGREVFNISEPQDFIVARTDMERLAKYLHFPVEDSSNGTMQRRESHELDQSLAKRRRKAGERTQRPGLPPRTSLHMSEQAGVIHIRLPRQLRALMFIILPLVFGIPFLMFAYSMMGDAFMSDPDMPAWFRVVFLTIFTAPIVLPVLMGLTRLLRRHELFISNNDLRYVRRLFATREEMINKTALEELDIDAGKVVAISDEQRMVIPVSTNHAGDTRFVYDMILYRLAS